MLFPSEEFLFAFLPIVVIVYYGIVRKSIMLKNIWLFGCSLFFYAWGEPVYVFLMIGVILIDYLMAYLLSLEKHNNKPKLARALLVVTIIVNVGILAWFKYSVFIENEIHSLLGKDANLYTGLIRELGMPIGISFFTFQAMSYVFDVYRGEVEAEKNPLYVGLYVSLFPQLIAGPIVRYSDVAKQMKNREEGLSQVSDGSVRFIKGLIKKVIIANNMALVADAAFELIIGGRLETSVMMAWLGAISYSLQIFFDFSGYSDMAIGLGQIFGFKFPNNFDHPYIAGSVTGFWRRWHISLSSWFRDYVYIPLGGSRKGIIRTVMNLFIVWCLTGIWHGANWTFLVWGLIYFIVLTVEKLFKIKSDSNSIVGHIYTLLVVCLAWVIFRADSLSDAFIYIRGMFGIGSASFIDKTVWAYVKQNAIYYIMAIVACFPLTSRLEEYFANKEGKLTLFYNMAVIVFYGISLLIAVSFIINKAYSPFIYFNF